MDVVVVVGSLPIGTNRLLADPLGAGPLVSPVAPISWLSSVERRDSLVSLVGLSSPGPLDLLEDGVRHVCRWSRRCLPKPLASSQCKSSPPSELVKRLDLDDDRFKSRGNA